MIKFDHDAVCVVCGKTWLTTKQTSSKACSRSCTNLQKTVSLPTTTLNCAGCGCLIVRSNVESNKAYCTIECLNKHHPAPSSISDETDGAVYVRRLFEIKYVMTDDVLSYDTEARIPYVNKQGRLDTFIPIQMHMRDGSIVLEWPTIKVDADALEKLSAMRAFTDRCGGVVDARLYNVKEFSSNISSKTTRFVNEHGTFSRPRLEYVFMTMARSLAERSTCTRHRVGAVFTDANMQQAFCIGYNGDEIGGKNQCDSLKPGQCGCIHAEINALTKNNFDITNSTCFVTLSPCIVCAKVLINRRVAKVVYLDDYRDDAGIKLLRARGIEVVRYDDI